MRPALTFFLVAPLFFLSCSQEPLPTLHALLSDQPALVGKPDYLNSPFVTAGDRVYLVGHQNGGFPDLGWHVTGEMGGIWNHPIKLMDGFSIGINNGESYWCLDNATRFINHPFANRHEYELGDRLRVSRIQFVPDALEGLIVEIRLENVSYKEEVLKVDFSGFTDLRPTWLAERQQVQDGEDLIVWNDKAEAFVAKDVINPWYVVFTTSERDQLSIGIDGRCDLKNAGNGTKAMLSRELTLEQGEVATLQYYISGSVVSESEALQTIKLIQRKYPELVQEKQTKYDQITRSSAIEIPDAGILEMYNWVKYNTDWLIRDVEGLGRGLSAGIPDYPWWFGADNCYSLQGLLATGRHEEVLSTIQLLQELSNAVNSDGHLMHEASTNGEVYNPGNLNETPHFGYLIWKVYEWTGDRALLEKMYPMVKKGLGWIEGQDKDQNGYPDGPGMMEIQGLHTEMIDVVVYTQQAYEAASKMAKELGESALGDEYAAKAAALKEKINTEWWVSSANSYADFRAGKWEAFQLIEDAIVRADTIKKPWTVAELTELKTKLLKNPLTGTTGHVVHHNWVVNTPMEMGVADTSKALLALETASAFRNRFGMYVTGIDRDEAQAEKWKSFSYVGAVMTLPTGVQAIAEARYGRVEQSLAWLQMLRESFGYALPGSMYEVSPDYGMIVQAWNSYAVVVPIVEYYFGIKPQAHKKLVTIAPQLPRSWENVAIKDVVVGENKVSFRREQKPDRIRFTFNQTQTDWTIEFTALGREVFLNGAVVEAGTLQLKGLENVVEVLN